MSRLVGLRLLALGEMAMAIAMAMAMAPRMAAALIASCLRLARCQVHNMITTAIATRVRLSFVEQMRCALRSKMMLRSAQWPKPHCISTPPADH